MSSKERLDDLIIAVGAVRRQLTLLAADLGDAEFAPASLVEILWSAELDVANVEYYLNEAQKYVD